MKARVMYNGSLLSLAKEFPDDLAVGAEVEWTIRLNGDIRKPITNKVIGIRKLAVPIRSGVTHEVEVAPNDVIVTDGTRMVVGTVPDGTHLLASDIAIMVMLVNNRIIEGDAGPEILGLQKRLSALIPSVLLKEGANPTAIPLYKDV